MWIVWSKSTKYFEVLYHSTGKCLINHLMYIAVEHSVPAAVPFQSPASYFNGEVEPNLVKLPLKSNGGLDKLGSVSWVKWATGIRTLANSHSPRLTTVNLSVTTINLILNIHIAMTDVIKNHVWTCWKLWYIYMCMYMYFSFVFKFGYYKSTTNKA